MLFEKFGGGVEPSGGVTCAPVHPFYNGAAAIEFRAFPAEGSIGPFSVSIEAGNLFCCRLAVREAHCRETL